MFPTSVDFFVLPWERRFAWMSRWKRENHSHLNTHFDRVRSNLLRENDGRMFATLWEPTLGAPTLGDPWEPGTMGKPVRSKKTMSLVFILVAEQHDQRSLFMGAMSASL